MLTPQSSCPFSVVHTPKTDNSSSSGCHSNNRCWVLLGNSVSLVQSLSCVLLFVTPWTVAHQAFLFITNSQKLLRLMSIESVIPSNHLTLCHLLLLWPSIFPSIRVFSNESVLYIRYPKYWRNTGNLLYINMTTII